MLAKTSIRNELAIRLLQKPEFIKVGEIPKGLRVGNGKYVNTLIFALS